MMSYDPSSLNRNKTLLEAIEEVKKFLIANPCYKVFYANTNYLVGTTTYSKTYIDDADSIAEYDVVFFNNNYYGKVESVGDSTFTIIGATNFKGDTGAQGTPGTPGTPGADGQDGADGVSITNVSIDASKHLICTLSDGNTIDAGEIPTSTDHTITLLSSSGVLTNEQYAELGYDNSIIKYEINSVPYFFRKESEDATQITFRCIRPHSTDTRIPDFIITKAGQGYQYYDSSITISGISVKSGTATAGQVLTADGDGFANWQSVEGTAVKSTGETSGKVLTADGSGGASWETAGGGGGTSLNKYTFTASSSSPTDRIRFYNIVKNAKGNIMATHNDIGVPLTISLNSLETQVRFSYVQVNDDGSQRIGCGRINGTDGSFVSPYSYQADILNTGSSTPTSLTTNPFGIFVVYYNDTEILS